MTIDDIADHLESVRFQGASLMARCPVHKDRTPSLRVSEGNTGIVMYCHGCGAKAPVIMRALGLHVSDLRPGSSVRPSLPLGPGARAAFQRINGQRHAAPDRFDDIFRLAFPMPIEEYCAMSVRHVEYFNMTYDDAMKCGAVLRELLALELDGDGDDHLRTLRQTWRATR